MNKTVGILGGGQLGRMLAESANRLNVKVSILDKENAPATQVHTLGSHISGSFKDADQIRQLARGCDVLTIEIEHVDTRVLEEIAESHSGVTIEPHWRTIRIIQDKYDQKLHLKDHGLPVAEAIGLPDDSEETIRLVGQRLDYPFMLKSRREAYDGRGNFPVRSESDISAARKALGNRGPDSLYAERWAPFTMELAVMVVNTAPGALAFPTVETVHENSICKLVYAPARAVSSFVAAKAQELAKKAVSSFQGKGVYGVEMFLLPDSSLLINEIAPRPHNSGHYTIEACRMSQFDAHLRAILDLPIPADALTLREPAVMLNILGGSTPEAHLLVRDEALAIPGACIHMYGKGAGSMGRKMGHITLTAHSMSEAETAIQSLIHAADLVSGNVSPGTPAPTAAQLHKSRPPLVAVIMGSHSDLPTLKPGLQVLEQFDIPFTTRITSAHRTPTWMAEFASTAAANGTRVIVAAAGGAAHLPGMAAAHTPLPVIGVPVKASSTDGIDSLLSIVAMPRGVPVAAVAIGNSVNAALLAARILGVADARVRRAVEEYARNAEEEVRDRDRKLAEDGWETFLSGMSK